MTSRLNSDAENIIRRTAAAFGLTVEQLRSPHRFRKFTEPRFAAYWLLRKHLTVGGRQRSFPEIGRLLGGKDHSSVMHGIARAIDIAERDPVYAAKLRALDEGKEVFGPPRPLDRKDRPPVWNHRKPVAVQSAPVIAMQRKQDDEQPELSALAFEAMMRRGSFQLRQALLGIAA